jgi:hypothetical protein
MRYLTDDLEVRSDPAHGTVVRMVKQLRMELDGEAENRAAGALDGRRDIALIAERAYDSKPPKPPR